MKPDIVEFVESTLGLKLTEFQKKLLKTYYEHKDEMTETLYLNVGRSQKKVIIEGLRALLLGLHADIISADEFVIPKTESAEKQEPCEDCISRQAVLSMQYRIDDSATLSMRDVVNVDDIEDLPPVTPQPKIGWWITEKVDGGYKVYCSKCKGSAVFEYVHDGDIYSSYGHGVVKKTKYCPDCGTKMIPQPYCAE